MRLWSIHPKYLDTKGLVAVWREGLLALNVLKGNTVGYRNHPQLDRFKAMFDPKRCVSNYLWFVHSEADARGYNFDKTKLLEYRPMLLGKIPVTIGQVKYEWCFLRDKVISRTGKWDYAYDDCFIVGTGIGNALAHPLFKVIDGDIEPWEKVKEK